MSLIDRASFIALTLKECEMKINQNGVIVQMQQGQYTIDRENPACKTYTAMLKSYQNVIGQLLSLVPKDDVSKISNEALGLLRGDF